MRKIDKHFSISPDLDNKIKISLKKSKRSYSDELNFIINEYFKEKEELEKILISLDSDMKFVARKMNILFELVKQIYSDMDFSNINDPNRSYAVNEFMKKMKRRDTNEKNHRAPACTGALRRSAGRLRRQQQRELRSRKEL